MTVLLLLAVTRMSSAGSYLADGWSRAPVADGRLAARRGVIVVVVILVVSAQIGPGTGDNGGGHGGKGRGRGRVPTLVSVIRPVHR